MGRLDPPAWALQPRDPGESAHRNENELEAVRKNLEAADRWEFSQRAANVGTMDALEFVLRGLRGLLGRKAVFLVSEGFPLCSTGMCPLDQRLREAADVARRLREIADLANRSATVVYTISASGLPTLSLDASMSSPPRINNPQVLAGALGGIRSAYFDAQSSLAYLAQQTEGLFVHDDNDIGAAMHELMDDLSGYYLIGYKPSADSFIEGKAVPGYHRIQVKVKVRGLRVRTRPGFFGFPDGKTRPVYRTRHEQLKAAIVSPFQTSGVRVEVAPQFLSKGSKNSLARLWLHIDLRDLTLQVTPDGSMKSTADLVAVAYGDNGAVAGGFDGTLKGSFQHAEHEVMRQHGVNYSLDLPIKEPGGYQVRVAVRDPASQKVGSAGQFIEIPKLRPDRLALSGIVLNATVMGESGPAMRRLKAGDRLSYELEIYNARRDSATQATNLEGRIQIFRDGRLVSAQKPGAIRQDPGDSKRLVMSGEFALAPEMAPGDYLLLVTVIDKLAPPRHSTARQWIDFEVVP